MASSRTCLLLLAGLVACSSTEVAPAGPPGAPGAPGEDPPAPVLEPSLNQISPRAGLLGRTLEVTVSASNLTLERDTEVEFGAGISVDDAKVVAGSLVLTVTIDEDAPLGTRDVKVTPKGGQPLVGQKAFAVAVPLDVKVSGGKPEQGGLVRVDVQNRDAVWFDTENFTLIPLAPQNAATLVPLGKEGFTATDGSVILLGDPLAVTGPLGFLGVNDLANPASATYLSVSDAVTVAPRTPIPIAANASFPKTFFNPLETAFFATDVTPAANEALLVDAWAKVPADSTMQPMLLGYPETGSIGDLLDQKQEDPGFPAFGLPATQARIAFPVLAQTKSFFVAFDANLANSPTTKLDFSFGTTRAQIVPETANPHEVGGTPHNLGTLPGTAVTIPGRVVTGELVAAGESDVYAFSGLSASNPTDMQVSIASDVDVVVLIDTVPTFDSDAAVELTRGGKIGSVATSGLVGSMRYIAVLADPDGTKQTGKYSLGIKRITSP